MKTLILCILSLSVSYCQTNDSSVNKKNSTVAEQKIIQNNNRIIGNWFIPHNADINITFNKNGTFIFLDYNSKLEKEEILKGKYKLNGDKLILIYIDRPKQTFSFYRGSQGDDNYYIKKGNYYFVKSSKN